MGLGKPRSRYGAFLDRNRIAQERIREETKVSRDIITRVCNSDYYPSGTTMRKLVQAARRLTGENVSIDDFWPM